MKILQRIRDIRREKGRARYSVIYRTIAVVIIGCLLFSGSLSRAEGNIGYEAGSGEGWSVSTGGILRLENNEGWKNFLRNGYAENLYKLVIGKDLTSFALYDLNYEKPSSLGNSDSDHSAFAGVKCPVLQPLKIEVEAGNNTFAVENGR